MKISTKWGPAFTFNLTGGRLSPLSLVSNATDYDGKYRRTWLTSVGKKCSPDDPVCSPERLL